MVALGTVTPGTFRADLSSAQTTIVGAQPVLQAIASADDATFLADVDKLTHTGIGVFELGDTPADFATMSTLTVQLRYANEAALLLNTWDSLTAQIMRADGTTPLTNQVTVVNGPITVTTPTNSAVVNFTGVDQTADKTVWDGALLFIRISITKNMGGDDVDQRVHAGELTGDYTAAAPEPATVAAVVASASADAPAPVVSTVATGHAQVTWAEVEAPAAAAGAVTVAAVPGDAAADASVPSVTAGAAAIPPFIGANTTNGTSILATGALPAGTATGDLLVAFVQADDKPIRPASGSPWRPLAPIFGAVGQATSDHGTVFQCNQPASPPAGWLDFACNSSDIWQVTIFAWDTTAEVDQFEMAYSPTAGAHATPTITPDQADSAVIYGLAYDSSNTATHVTDGGVGHTELVDTVEAGALLTIAAYSTDVATPAAVSQTITISTGTDEVAAFAFVVADGVTATGRVDWSTVGGPADTSARITARITDADTGGVLKVSTATDLSAPVFTSSNVAPDAVGMVTFTATGLAADTVYHYGVEVDGQTSDPDKRGTFRTLPTVGTQHSFTVAHANCMIGPSEALDHINNVVDPLLVVFLGDFDYQDNTAAEGMRASYASQLWHFRLASLVRSRWFVYTWDDHDFGGNSSDGTFANKTVRSAEYSRHFPHGALVDATTDGAIYRSFVVGRVRFIVLDERYYSSPIGQTDDASKTVLGAAQKAWLFSELTQPEPLKVLCHSRPWHATGTGSDDWSGYTTERAEIADEIESVAAQVIHLSGDAHGLQATDAAEYTTGGTGAPEIALHGGSVAQVGSVKGGPWTITRLGATTQSVAGHRQYGLLTFTDNGTSIDVSWEGRRSLDGTTFTVPVPTDGAPLTASFTAISGAVTVAAVTADASADAAVPAVSAGGAATVQAVSADATADAPASTVSAGAAATVTAVSADATADASVPIVTAGAAVTVAAVSADATADAPTPSVVSADAVTVQAVVAEATADFAAEGAVIEAAIMLQSPGGDATADAPAPAVSTAAGATIAAVPGDATADAPAPTVTAAAATGHAQVTWAEVETPAAAVPVTIAAAVGSAAADAPAPVVSSAATTIVQAAVAEATADAPSGGFVAAANTIEAPVGSATATAPPPTVGAAAATVVNAEPASASADAPAATVTADRAVTVAAVAASASADIPPPVVTSAATTIVQAAVATAAADAPPAVVKADRTVAAAAADATADSPEHAVLAAAAAIVDAAAAAAAADFPPPIINRSPLGQATWLETGTQDRWTGTVRPSRWPDPTATQDRWAGTVRSSPFAGDTTRLRRFLTSAAPDRWAGTIRPTRFFVTTFYREGENVALTTVPLGPYTQNEVPESLMVRWLRTHADDTKSGLPLHGQTPAWTVTAHIEQPSGSIVTRACEILDPATLTTEFPDVADEMVNGDDGWVRMPFAAADLDEITVAPNAVYGIQLVADQASPGVLLLKTQDVWVPEVNVGPAALVVSA